MFKININQLSYFTFSFFECSIENIENLLLSELVSEQFHISKKHNLSFDLYQTTPKKGGSHLNKAYFFAPKLNNELTIMMSNYADGWQTLTAYISDKLQINAHSFCITNSPNITEPYNSFSTIKKGKEIRTVYNLMDGKWEFYSSGNKQWFEDERNYTKRLIKRRLNKEILFDYCLKLGVNLNDESFWESEQEVLVFEMLKHS